MTQTQKAKGSRGGGPFARFRRRAADDPARADRRDLAQLDPLRTARARHAARQSKLASRFGVSRGSVREAIWELIDSGLLVNRPYAGTFVVSLDEKTTTEVFSLRGALEHHCYKELWPKRDETFRKEFTERYNTLVKTIKARKYFDTIEAEMHFHSYPFDFAKTRHCSMSGTSSPARSSSAS